MLLANRRTYLDGELQVGFYGLEIVLAYKDHVVYSQCSSKYLILITT